MPRVGKKEQGVLYVVATPIGNMGDFTARAVNVLGKVSLVAAEDTREARRIFTRYGLQTSLTSFFEHNEVRKLPEILQYLEQGKNVALISDAGTPLISDPGYRLVRAAQERGIPVVPVPGPSAVMAALSVAGLPTDRFLFVGFLPRKAGKRRKELERLSEVPYTLVLFESPHRLVKTLQDLGNTFGDRTVVLCRELTKAYEEILRGTPEELLETLEDRKIRGEITLVIAGKKEEDAA